MVAAPSYIFTLTGYWQHGQHTHHEPVQEIRRLRPRLTACWRRHWDKLPPETIEITFHRGFISAVSIVPSQFIRHAGKLFSEHPIQTVTLHRLTPAFFDDGTAEADLVQSGFTGIRWPAELFFGEHGKRILFESRDDAMAKLGFFAWAYGRMRAGMANDPPQLRRGQ